MENYTLAGKITIYMKYDKTYCLFQVLSVQKQQLFQLTKGVCTNTTSSSSTRHMIDFPDVDVKMEAHNGNYTNPLECYHNCKRRAKAKYCNKPKRMKGKQIIKINCKNRHDWFSSRIPYI